MIRKIIALVPVCVLAVACGGEQTPEPATPDAAATEEMPAEGEAAPAEVPAEAPAEVPAEAPAEAPAEPPPAQ